MLRRLSTIVRTPKTDTAVCTHTLRRLCSSQPQPVVLYHFSYVRHLRQLLRMKVLQLGAGVGVFLPVGSVLSSGGVLTVGEVSFGHASCAPRIVCLRRSHSRSPPSRCNPVGRSA